MISTIWIQVLAATAVAASSISSRAAAASIITVDAGTTFQDYDGLGFSQAFQRATHIRGTHAQSPLNQTLSAHNSSVILDLLFTQKGANMNILRNGIGASPTAPYDLMLSIEPKSPGSPDGTPHYYWNNTFDDGSQLWLSKEARKRQKDLIIYADSWSADGYMKNNSVEYDGGYLCGVTGVDCGGEDWRQAYANKLAEYVKLYADRGVHIDYLGFLNEPVGLHQWRGYRCG